MFPPLLFTFTAAVLSLVYCDVYRLPNRVKPIRYHLTMDPDLSDTDIWESVPYEGSVVIELIALKNTRNITFHQVRLPIDDSSITIHSSNGKVVRPSATSKDTETQTYTINLDSELVKGENYNLTIGKFTGKLGTSEGFFKAYYWEKKAARGLAATHFEPTGARRAFPCFDEPSLKAKFIVSLIRKEGYISVSNENLETTENLGDGRFKDTFKETPIMSTYTLAFAVSNYKSSEKLERHRILARPEAIDNGQWKYSLKIANKTLKALEEYTGIDFVIDKMDQIAIPDGYFYESAMENWGLIVYGEKQLLRNNESEAEDYQRSTCYIAHEFAHQWFGNLVTPEWWDYMWLSEGFATYFQFHIADVVQPSWRLKEQFLIEMVRPAFEKEVQMGAHPLNYNIHSSGQYPPFHIMYEKASSIIRMTEHFLTHDVFKKGLQIYLQKNKFGNVVPSDLYAAFQEAVDRAGVNTLLNNMPVREILGTWDSNKGFPIVTVTRNYTTGSITLEQQSRFENYTITKWIIPINFVFSIDEELDFTKTTADHWLTEESTTINLPFPTDGWLLVNKQQTGHYRVNYDLENWDRLVKFLNSDNFASIDVLNRAQLIDDAFSLAYIGKLPWRIPLGLGEYIIREKDYIPLANFYNAIDNYLDLVNFLDYQTPEPKEFKYFGDYTFANTRSIAVENVTELDVYKEYIKTALSGVKHRLGFKPKPDDTHLDRLHRTKFTFFQFYFDDVKIVEV